jgi:AcrR family transcriptional regulator
VTASPRRTQAQRRSETIEALIDATIEAIAEVGYHRTSLGEVCQRSGISKGGLFRHFASRLELVVAAAEEVGRRHFAAFDEFRAEGGSVEIVDLLLFARKESRDPSNSVWFELLVAARTDPELRERLNPVAVTLYDNIEARAAAAFAGRGIPSDVIRLFATSALHMFDGEAIFRHTYPRPELEAERIAATASLYESLTTAETRADPR